MTLWHLIVLYHNLIKIKTNTTDIKKCHHCGEPCKEEVIALNYSFCCTGCSQVFMLLNENGLCSYYDLDASPGIKAKGKFAAKKFEYLNDLSIIEKLAQFRSEQQVNITFNLPQMHCASCIFLLENLHKINKAVIKSRVNFDRKEVFITYDPSRISLTELVQLLAFIGYEPSISLNDDGAVQKNAFNRGRIIELGVAGFAFSNIMMLSFPEYFSGGDIAQEGLKETFTWIIFVLSLPVLFFSARSIFISAWKGLRQGIINIDAPIAFASFMTFGRSYFEIITATGSGYLDSGTGIIFFMLIGRWFQSKTYDAISFDRQYRSYFPLGVTVLKDHKEENIPATKLKVDDIIIIRNEEMIPADAVLLQGKANIDYSFVSGENDPVAKQRGETLFAGGTQKGAMLQLRVVKEPSQSYITQLWNNDVFGADKHKEPSFIHPWSRYFTIVLFSVAAITAVYWSITNPANLWPAVTAVLIVACPCSLLLSATFTFGNMQRIFGRNKLYLKNAAVIESMAGIQHIVFDKTGTITQSGTSAIKYYGESLSRMEESQVRATAAQSSHLLSAALVNYLPLLSPQENHVEQFTETAGKGVLAVLNNTTVQLGSEAFIKNITENNSATAVHIKINEQYKGYYEITNQYRANIHDTIQQLKTAGYQLHVLSGDNDAEKNNLQQLFGLDTPLNFNVSPQQKLSYIQQISSQGKKVLMIGDGLNDAGALMQASCGIAVSNDAARFSPACDAIIDGSAVSRLNKLLLFAKWGRRIVMAGFILSILYNFVGISFAVQAKLSPLVAAILMPASSISIVLLASVMTALIARKAGLSSKPDETHVSA